MKEIIQGFKYNLLGLRTLMGTPALWKYVFIPLLINIIVFTFLISLSLWSFGDIFSWLTSKLGGLDITDPQGFLSHFFDSLLWVLRGLIKIILFIITLVIQCFLALLLSGLINSPFYEAMGERLLIIKGRRSEQPFRFNDLVRNVMYTLRLEMIKILFFTSASFLLFLCTLIPFVGPFFSIFHMMFTSWLLAWGLTVLPFCLERTPIRTLMHFGKHHKLKLIGFGLPALIPFLGIFLTAFQAVGAIHLHIDLVPLTPQNESQNSPVSV